MCRDYAHHQGELAPVSRRPGYPDRLIVIHAVRRDCVRRPDGHDSPFRGHEVTPEMRSFTAQQGRKVTIIPGGIRTHLGVQSEHEPCRRRDVVQGAFIPESRYDCQAIPLNAVLQRVAHPICHWLRNYCPIPRSFATSRLPMPARRECPGGTRRLPTDRKFSLAALGLFLNRQV